MRERESEREKERGRLRQRQSRRVRGRQKKRANKKESASKSEMKENVIFSCSERRVSKILTASSALTESGVHLTCSSGPISIAEIEHHHCRFEGSNLLQCLFTTVV